MKRRLGILVAGLLGPALACAQGAQQQTRPLPGAQQAQQPGQAPRASGGGEGEGQGVPAQGLGPEGALGGRITGVVQDVDWRHGILRIQTGLAGRDGQGGTVTLRGTPGQLQNFKRGEYTSVSFAQYGPSRWVALPRGNPEPADLRQAATVVGVVQAIDTASGTLTLSQEGQSVSLLAHPNTLEQLEPGQRVSLACQEEEGDCWVQHVQVAQDGQGGAQEL